MASEPSLLTHVAKMLGAAVVAAISAAVAMLASGKALGMLAGGATFVMIVFAVAECRTAIRLARRNSGE